MKLVRFGTRGQEKPGLLDHEGRLRDLSGAVDDIAGETLTPAGLEQLRVLDPESLPSVKGEPRRGPCVGRIGKFICIGLNYDEHRYQHGNTRTMTFGVAALVSYLSRCMSLQPGDVISTGTPPGVGLGIKPIPVYLRPGQVMRLGIAGLGAHHQHTVQGA